MEWSQRGASSWGAGRDRGRFFRRKFVVVKVLGELAGEITADEIRHDSQSVINTNAFHPSQAHDNDEVEFDNRIVAVLKLAMDPSGKLATRLHHARGSVKIATSGWLKASGWRMTDIGASAGPGA